MSDMDVNSVLLQMRAMAAKAHGIETQSVQKSDTNSFSSLLKSTLDEVNAMQKEASELSKAFETGSRDVDLAEVMLASQKAGLSFQAITQVRNRLVSAYQDIMNMPI